MQYSQCILPSAENNRSQSPFLAWKQRPKGTRGITALLN